jgi:hypothetical protein
MYGNTTESLTTIEDFTDDVDVSSGPPSPRLKRPRVQGGRDQILSDLRDNSYNIKHVTQTLMNDVSFLEEAAGIDGLLLDHFDKEYRANQDIVIAAVRQNGNALEHADVSLWNDKMIVKLAVENDCVSV